MFLKQFNQKITKLATKIGINTKNKSVLFESSLTVEPAIREKNISFLLSYDCQLYEVSYLGIPLKYKLKPVRFYNGLQLVVIELPMLPNANTKINITFKYYCTQNDYISFNKGNFLLNNNAGFFPHIPTGDVYECEAVVSMPEGWNLMTGCTEVKKDIKYSGQVVTVIGDNNGLSFIGCPSLRTSDSFGGMSINLLYPRQYLNQARLLNGLTKGLSEYFLTTLGKGSIDKVNIAVVQGPFDPYFDGSNIVFPCEWLDSIKSLGKTPKEREKLIFMDLSALFSKMWWSQVNVKHPDDVWLKDGFSEYFALLAIENKYGNSDFRERVRELQLLYRESRGFLEGLTLRNASYGMGKELDEVYPLNILLIHLLHFVLDKDFFSFSQEFTSWDDLNWDNVEEYIHKVFDKDISWIRECYILKHNNVNTNLARIDYDGIVLKGNMGIEHKVE